MKYQKIESITFDDSSGKVWAVVTFENGTKWMPAIKDLAEILIKIGYCEDLKYPTGEGYKYLNRYITECTKDGWKEREEIDDIYHDVYNPNNK